LGFEATAGAVAGHANAAPIQRQHDEHSKTRRIPYLIQIARPMTGEEFKIAAHMQELGLSYWAITDHSKSSYQANGLDASRLRQQLKSMAEKTRQGQLKQFVAALETKAAELEGNEGGYGRTFLSTADGRSLVRLNVGLNTLLAAVDSADAAPTTQAVSTFNDLNKALDQQLAGWDAIKSKDVPELNLKLKRSGLPQLNPELVTAGEDLSGNHNTAGDDEP